MNLFTKQKQTYKLREGIYGWQCGEGWREGVVRKFGMDVYTLLYLKWNTNKDLLYSTGNSAQCYVAAWMGGESEEMDWDNWVWETWYMYMYGWFLLLFT